MKVLAVIAAILWLADNIWVANRMSDTEMSNHFVKGQCIVGCIAANAFHAPAWFLKFLKWGIIGLVK